MRFHKNIEFFVKVFFIRCFLISAAESKVVSAGCKIKLSRNGLLLELIACKKMIKSFKNIEIS